ncbi:MAG: HAMP domain-containing sensor histidine kinase [Cellulophaga sp.]|uniref:sensor histidine kinase n=1 Tax=Cellulophaga sp. TaxID=1972202 RepID=UPI0032655F16
MVSAEEKLKERIKELTCLYDVTSIIVNCDYNEIEVGLQAIVSCLKNAWQYIDDTYVVLKTNDYHIISKKEHTDYVFLSSAITLFNKEIGTIKVGYPSKKYSVLDFLEEEQLLLNNVCLEVGNLLERKEIKENEILIKRQVEQSDRLRILGEITAGIAHELNTPLANILGFAELLKDRNKEDAQATKDVDKIINSAIYSREVVKKLMFFACEMPQQKSLVNIIPICKEAIELLKPILKTKSIAFNFTSSNPEIALKIDRIQLTQVLFNLVINAIYFSKEKGVIDLEIKDKSATVEIHIKDQGSGIDSKLGNKIFEPFFTTKPVGDGSGLGLSVVHGIVKSHKGNLSYSANTPKGTIFTVTIPKL